MFHLLRNWGLLALHFIILSAGTAGQEISVSGIPVNIELAGHGSTGVHISILPAVNTTPQNPLLAQVNSRDKVILKNIEADIDVEVNDYIVKVSTDPLIFRIEDSAGRLIQELHLTDSGNVEFVIDGSPVLGMGEGGPRVGRGWRDLDIEFDRRGRYHKMEPRWQGNSYGSRNPVPLLLGTSGWALLVAAPWVQVNMTDAVKGEFIPREALGLNTEQQNQENQQENTGKGLPPPETYLPGYFDIYVFDSSDPEKFYADLSELVGRAVMPPKWSLGYMQSHRTLEDEKQMLDIVQTFRSKKIPVDAVIYLGTGFCPRGWNTRQPSFDYNPEVFKSKPAEVIDKLHKMNVKAVVHIVPWDRDKLPTLHGSIPPADREIIDEGHIMNYWQQHINLVKSGIDGWWPDEGDWFNLYERVKRHQLYYQGPLSTTPGIRPWSLHRNGYLGVAKWGGWVWSGDTESSWKTLEGQIAVGINHSLSLSPYWGSDIGGFYPSEELDGELYARWFQFGAFCPSFRSHGRTWWTRLPWGWGLSEMGPLENRRNPLESELNNPVIENICRSYSELRYSLLSYNYTLAWEARDKGLPLMRAMWIHYPNDKKLRGLGDQYMWGRSVLVAPVYKKGATSRELYLPVGRWYDWWTGEPVDGGKKIKKDVDLEVMPLYIKAGSIIPIDPPRQYTGQETSDLLEVRVYTGEDAYYQLYDDDGFSLDYLKEKNINKVSFSWKNESRTLTVKSEGDGSLTEKNNKLRIVVIPGGEQRNIKIKKKAQTFKF